MADKTVIFFGAGATAYCSMPVTDSQAKLFGVFFFGNDRELKDNIRDKMCILTEDDAEFIIKLKNRNDIRDLIDFVNDMFTKESFRMLSFYNLVDMAISERRGFVGRKKEYEVDEIRRFRDSLLVILQTLFGRLENNILRDKQAEFSLLKNFFKSIAKQELNKRKMQYPKKSVNIQSKDFIFTDIEYVSLNWDVLILWAMMIAHKELNGENCNYISDEYGVSKLKVFNEFFVYLDSCDTAKQESNWYPYNQTVAFRLNDREHPSDRRVILFPAYFPHGQTHWLECSICGKLTMYLDKGFQIYSEKFAMNPDKEYHCAHCEKKLTLKDSAMLLQTNYKIKAPYNEEIQRSMRIAVNKAKKLVFVGYSLPDDDIEYNSIFRISNHEKKLVYVVLFQEDAKNEFFPSQDAKDMCKGSDTEKVIQRYCDIFGDENVNVNLAGFPNAISKILEILHVDQKLEN